MSMENRDPVAGPPDFLVVGHVTRDLVPGGWRLGGTSSYAARVAARLGLRVAVLTAAESGLGLAAMLPDVEVDCLTSPETTVHEHRYEGERRIHYLHGRARRLEPGDLPARLARCPMVLLGPVTDEIDPRLVACFSGSLIGATAQGWLRRPERDGSVSDGHLDALDLPALAGRVQILVLSEEDLAGQALPAAWGAAIPIVAVTRGRLGARLLLDGAWWEIPAFPACELDATGAGDAFAAALMIGYRETADLPEAMRFAAAVASFVVEAPGIGGAPTRSQVAARLQAHPEVVLRRVPGV